MKWQVAVRARYGNFGPTEFVVTDGCEVVGEYSYGPFPHWRARLKAWRLNRKRVPTVSEIVVERQKFDQAMKELGG